MNAAGKAVGPYATRLVALLSTPGEGRMQIPMPGFLELIEAAKATAPGNAEAAAKDLLALAIEINLRAGEAADVLLGQIYFLVVTLIGAERAAAVVEETRQANESLRRVGAEANRVPVGSTPLASGRSVMAWRLGLGRSGEE